MKVHYEAFCRNLKMSTLILYATLKSCQTKLLQSARLLKKIAQNEYFNEQHQLF